MLRQKICLIGGPAVGKTSLVARLVRNFFTERHLATIGVRIDKHTLEVRQRELMLVIWDLAGADEFTRAATAYLRGAAGYLVVVDGTRRESLTQAYHLQRRAEQLLGPVPFLVVVNKADMEEAWEIGARDLDELGLRGWAVLKTSAKSGSGVERVFHLIAERILDLGEARPSR